MNPIRKYFWQSTRHGRWGDVLWLLALLMDAGLAKLRRLAKKRRPAGKIRVLVIRLDDLGDFFLWLPFAEALRRHYPADRYELTLLGNPPWIDAAPQLMTYDRYLTLDRRKFEQDDRYFLEMAELFSIADYDLLIQPRHYRFLKIDDLFLFWVRPAESWTLRYDYDHAYSRKARCWMRLVDACYTHPVPLPPTKKELEISDGFLRAIAGTSAGLDLPTDWVNFAGPDLPTPYFVVLPGTATPARQWPGANFAEVITAWLSRTEWTCVLCGGPRETELAAEIMARVGSPRVVNRCGQTTILQLCGVIAGARMVVGNDTGGIHIAALAKVPSVVIIGGGHWGKFLPYPETERFHHLTSPRLATVMHPCFGCGWQCHKVPAGQLFPCVAEVTPAQVLREMKELFSESG